MPEEIKFNLSKILKFKLPENWQSNKRWFYISLVLLLAIVILGVAIRSTNIPYLKDVTTGNYTLGPDLDPFLYLRLAHEIIDYGHELNPDYMRYLGMVPTYRNFVPYGIVGIYKFLSIFSETSLEYAAIIFPVIFFGLSIIAFFFFVREIFNKKGEVQRDSIAIIATLLYSILPAMMHRTTAGIPELESAGLFFFWLSFFLILKAFNSDGKIFGKFNKRCLFALLAGISTSLMSYTWGGFRFIFLAIPLATLIAFFLGRIKKEESWIYFSWYIPSAITLALRSGIQSLFFDIATSTLSLIVFLTLFIHLIIKEKMWEKIREKIKIHISKEAFSFLLVILAGLILAIFIKPGFILNLFPNLIQSLLHPFGATRTGLTVAENAQPYVTSWISELSAPIFWMFFMGTIFLFYESVRNLDKKDKRISFISFVLFLTGFIFSNYSSDSIFNGVSLISQVTYFGSLFILIFGFFYIYRKNAKNNSLKEIEFSYLFTISLIILMVLASRGAIRLLVISSPVFIIPVAFLAVGLLSSRIKAKDDLWKLLLLILFLVVAFFIIFTVINYEKTTSINARYTIPSSYEIQWQKAMSWVRESTPINSIFVHWWDYGYWVQTIGKRPTVTDGGHSIGYWDHLTGRYLLTTPYPETALSLMKSYNVSYLLIDSTDLGKYPAYSIIGSDSSGNDRYSSIQIMPIDSAQTQITNDSTLMVYQNVIPVDEDITLNTSNGQVFLPQGRAYFIATILKTSLDGTSVAFEQPQGVFYYNNQQIRVPIRYLYFDGKLKDFGGGFEGAAYVLPVFSSESGVNAQINNFGSVIYLSPKVFKSLFAQLYLMDDPFNEYSTVKIAHSEDSELISSLKSQGFHGDFIYYNGFNGPLKIWKVTYSDDVLARDEFLRTDGEYAEFDNLTFVQ
jgi:dolichyl-diphosphooligosaccharide--protein glycosyltransferase